MDKNKLIKALQQLDANDDNHWTADGSPRIDVLKELIGTPTLSRAEVDIVAPGFNRAAAANGQYPQFQDTPETAPESPTAPETPPQDTTPQPAPEKPAEKPPESKETVDKETYEAEVNRLKGEIQEIDGKLAELAEQRTKLQAELHDVVSEMNLAYPPPGTQEVIMNYIAAQNEARARQLERQNRLKELQLTPKDVELLLSVFKPSALDAAMAYRR